MDTKLNINDKDFCKDGLEKMEEESKDESFDQFRLGNRKRVKQAFNDPSFEESQKTHAMIESMTNKYTKAYDPHFSTPPGVYVETSYSVLAKKYFTNSVHIFAVGCALGLLSLFNLAYGAFSGIFLLVKDGLGSCLL